MVFLTPGTLHKPVLPVDLVMKAESALRAAGSFGYDDIGDACARIEQGVLSLAHDERSGWREIEEAASRIAAFTSSGRAAAV